MKSLINVFSDLKGESKQSTVTLLSIYVYNKAATAPIDLPHKAILFSQIFHCILVHINEFKNIQFIYCAIFGSVLRKAMTACMSYFSK